MTDQKEKKPTKNMPSILPSGFAMRVTQRKMALLDFIDLDYDNNPYVIGSYALDMTVLEDLSKAINEVLGKIKK
jgi:hypothetical protein